MYTNVVSPIETPGTILNQHFPMMGHIPPHLQQNRYQNIPPNLIPPDTPISKIPNQATEGDPNQRRRSPVMQRAGINMVDHQGNKQNQPPKNGKNKNVADLDAQLQGLNPKQLIGIIKDKDNKINDLVETVEVNNPLFRYWNSK